MPAWLNWTLCSTVKIVHYKHDANLLFGLCVQLNTDGRVFPVLVRHHGLMHFSKDYNPIKGSPIIIIIEEDNIGK